MANTKKTKKPQSRAKTQPATNAPDKGAWREVVGILLIGVGLVLLYFLVLGGSQGASLAVNRVMAGFAGVLKYIVPILFVWLGILVIFSKRTGKISLFNTSMVILLALCVCAFVHAFSFEAVRTMVSSERVSSEGYFNFIRKSAMFSAQNPMSPGGVGALGAILCWPLYYKMGMGLAGTLIALIVIVLALLVLLRKISIRTFGEKVQQRYSGIREQAQQRHAERAEQMTVEDMPKQRAKVAKNDLDELENWPDAKKPAVQETKTPPRKPSLQPVAEMDIPKFNPGQAVLSKSTVDPSGLTPIEAETPGDVPDGEVPEFLLKGGKRPKSDAKKLQIKQPQPILDPTQPEQVDDSIASGAMQFPLDGLDQWQEMSIGDELYDEDELNGQVEVEDDDEPPFDMPEEKPAVQDIPVAKPVPRTAAAMPVATPVRKLPVQEPVEDEEEPYNYPPIDLLQASKPGKIQNQEQLDAAKAQTLLATLESFGIKAKLIGIAHGPTVTRFELSPAAGIKVSRITALADDIALNLAAISVRIEAPIPGKAAVGVEVPNDVVEVVPLRDVLESNEARRHPSRLATALGRDNAGRYIVADLAKMPHVLIAGATGAGKSVCINSLICSILYRATPDEVRLIMIDPKVVELSAYNGIPHLLVPVVTDPKKAASALEWAVQEMSTRYKKFAELGVRDMKGYNQHRPKTEEAMPQIVIIIDELADLMMVTPGEVEDSICRLAQLARAAGIHLVIATQRPSVNVITGVIKANIPSRIAFTVASQVDSRTILDVGGAEKLLGRGDMLFAPSGSNKPTRVQGAWISDEEVHSVVEYIKDLHEKNYDEDLIEHIAHAEISDAERDDQKSDFTDELLPQAIEIAVEAGQASISMLQRRLRVGYARAGRLIDEMAARGVISQAEGAKPREVLVSREQFKMMFEDN